jgi:hypothetical protein
MWETLKNCPELVLTDRNDPKINYLPYVTGFHNNNWPCKMALNFLPQDLLPPCRARPRRRPTCGSGVSRERAMTSNVCKLLAILPPNISLP